MKRIFWLIFIIPLIGSASFSYGQTSSWLWARSAIGNSLDQGLGITSDVFGNVYVTGYFTSTTITLGSFVLTNVSGWDFYVAKYDASGTVIWAKSASSGIGNSICTDAAGNVLVAGAFGNTITFGSVTLTNSTSSSSDLFIVKYDTNGNVLWAKSAQGAISRCSITVDLSGNAFVTGTFRSPTLVIGSTTLTNSGNSRIFLAKYDTNGNVLWAKSAGGTNFDYSYSVSADISGNAFIVGGFNSPTIIFGSTTLINAGIDDVFLAKYDPNGNVIWAKSAGGSGGEQGFSLSADVSGNIFITGYFGSPTITFGSITLTNAVSWGEFDVFLAKYDGNGNVLWAKSGNGTNLDEGKSISTDAGGNVFVTGGFSSPTITFGSTTLTQPSGSVDPMFIVKYDPNGSLLCASALSSGGGDNSDVSANLLGDAYVIGTFYSHPFIVGSDTLILGAPTGAQNVFVAKYVCCSNNFPVTISGTSTVFQGQATTLTAIGGVNYLWNNGETTTAISVTPATTTIYCVTVSDTNKCSDTACIKIYVESPCDTAGTFFFPNAFSPNNDADNDMLKIYYRNMDCIVSLHLVIYDRWGEMVYETSDKNFQWDGTYPNQTLNTQVLAYHLSVGFADGKTIYRKGNISLVR